MELSTVSVTLADLVKNASEPGIFTTFLTNFFSGTNIALLGAVLALFITGFGSCKGVMMVANAATPVINEDPSKFGKAIVLEALPGTQGLYGFVTAFIILMQLGLFSDSIKVLTIEQGVFVLLACLPITIIGYYSAIKQATVAVSGVTILDKHPEDFMKGVISAALVETYAAFAFLTSLLACLLFLGKIA